MFPDEHPKGSWIGPVTKLQSDAVSMMVVSMEIVQSILIDQQGADLITLLELIETSRVVVSFPFSRSRWFGCQVV